MKIYPAIDLIDGHCVRLYQGRYDEVTQYQHDPVELALRYQQDGAELLHVVDLNAAKDGNAAQLEVIAHLAAALSIPLQTGGGVRTVADVQARFDAGCHRVAVGSVAVSEPEVFRSWLSRFGAERMVAALDVRRDAAGIWRPAVRGWREDSAQNLFELLDYFSQAGLRHVLCTDIARDGALNGANAQLYQELCAHFPNLHIQASGGVGNLAELSPLASTGAAAVIVGKALFEGRFALPEAIQAVQNSSAQAVDNYVDGTPA